MNRQLKTVTRDKGIWTRVLYMLLFVIIYSFTEILITLVSAGQLATVLLSGKKNHRLLKLGQSLSIFVYQMMQFFTFNSETKPFPFDEWPDK